MNTNKELSVWPFKNDSSLRPLFDLRREMDRLFDDFWSVPGLRSRVGSSDQSWVPVSDVQEEEGHYLLSVEMPGVSKDDVKVELVDHEIVVSGERKQEMKDGGYSERRYSRSFSLPDHIDAEKIEANYEDGVLKLFVPKAESAKPRQIKIGSGSGAASGFFNKLLGEKKTEKEVENTSRKSA